MINKILANEDLRNIRSWHENKKIAHCHGVFDVFHFGHLEYLQSAKAIADILVVTITSDDFVNKGPQRPYHKQEQRAQIIAELDCVDYVAINDSSNAVPAIEKLQADYYVKGRDYKAKEEDKTGGIYLEEEAVEKFGGKLKFTDSPLLSSTKIINNHLNVWDDETKAVLDRIRESYSFDQISSEIQKFERLKVLIIGEPIIDTYSYCEPEAISSKSPTISARHLYTENYAGGSLAIANNLQALGCEVGLLGVFGDEVYVDQILEHSLSKSIKLEKIELGGLPTPRKTRFIEKSSGQKLFEKTEIRHDQWSAYSPDEFCGTMLRLSKDYDLLICADFGHGLFEGKVLDCLQETEKFIALNVQTNSSNIGFNLFTKHSAYDYLSIDERELRLGLHNRSSDPLTLARSARPVIKSCYSVTLGNKGSVYCSSNESEVSCPAFANKVIDATGAGDAYFLITSLLVYNNVSPLLIPFLGNCYAGLYTQIIGNKYTNTLINLERTVKSLVA